MGLQIDSGLPPMEDMMAAGKKSRKAKKKGGLEFGCANGCDDVIVSGGGKRKPLEFGLPVTLQIRGGETIRIEKESKRRRKR